MFETIPNFKGLDPIDTISKGSEYGAHFKISELRKRLKKLLFSQDYQERFNRSFREIDQKKAKKSMKTDINLVKVVSNEKRIYNSRAIKSINLTFNETLKEINYKNVEYSRLSTTCGNIGKLNENFKSKKNSIEKSNIKNTGNKFKSMIDYECKRKSELNRKSLDNKARCSNQISRQFENNKVKKLIKCSLSIINEFQRVLPENRKLETSRNIKKNSVDHNYTIANQTKIAQTSRDYKKTQSKIVNLKNNSKLKSKILPQVNSCSIDNQKNINSERMKTINLKKPILLKEIQISSNRNSRNNQGEKLFSNVLTKTNKTNEIYLNKSKQSELPKKTNKFNFKIKN